MSNKEEDDVLERLDLKRFLKILYPHQIGVWLALILSVLGAAVEGSIPVMLKPLVDSADTKNFSFLGFNQPWIIPLAIVFLFSFRALINYVSSYVMTQTVSRMVRDTRNKLFDHILYVEPQIFESQPASQFINTISVIVQNGISELVGTVQTLVKEGLTLIFLVSFMLWTNWQLTLIAFIVLPCSAIAIKIIRKKLEKVIQSSQVGLDQLTYAVEENVLAYRTVRLHGVQKFQGNRFQTTNSFLQKVIMRMVATGNMLTPITQFLAAIAIAVIITFALAQTQNGELTIGSFAAYIGSMLAIVPRVKALSDIYPGIQRGTIAMSRVFALLDEPIEEDQGTFSIDRAKGDLEVRNLTKIYPESDRPALNAVSFKVKAGEIVALVGHSGSGKTTLVNMIPRFVKESSGSILLDTVPLPQWSLTSLRSQISMVSQDVILFNATIAENVALGEKLESINLDKVREALSLAHLLDFVNTLPENVYTSIGHNGYRFSGGQRQRLAIARALYRDTPLLVLDEATSALDSETERLVQLALESLTREKTTFIVAHRLSTIRNANKIIVLHEGEIVEMGTYDELLKKNGAFARLVEAQSALRNESE